MTVRFNKLCSLFIALTITVSLTNCFTSRGQDGCTFSFNNLSRGEIPGDDYIILNDGSRVTGGQLRWVNNGMAIGGQKLKQKEVREFVEANVYHRRYGKAYARRIIHGTVNVYRYRFYYSTPPTGGNDHLGDISNDCQSFYKEAIAVNCRK